MLHVFSGPASLLSFRGCCPRRPQRPAILNHSLSQDLICKLLDKDPATRLTASEACLHPWLSVPRAALSSHNLSANLEELRLYNAKRKLRAVVKTVRLFLRRMSDRRAVCSRFDPRVIFVLFV